MSLFKRVHDFNNQLRAKNLQSNTMIRGQSTDCATAIAAKVVFLVIDCSGSMGLKDYHPSRLQAAKDSAIEYVLTLKRQNCDIQIVVICFTACGSIIVPPTQIAESVKIIKGMRSLTAGGGTSIFAGLNQAEKILGNFPGGNRQNQIVLLTDGFGGQPLNIAGKLKAQYNSTIDVVGIGGSHEDVNEDLLRKVATTDPDGTNHYRFIKDRDTLKKHYRQLATGLVLKGKNND